MKTKTTKHIAGPTSTAIENFRCIVESKTKKKKVNELNSIQF